MIGIYVSQSLHKRSTYGAVEIGRACHDLAPNANRGRSGGVLRGLFLLAIDLPSRPASAVDANADLKPAEPAEQAGRLIRVPLPIAGSADTQVTRAVVKALAAMPTGGNRGVLVFDFASTQNQTGQGSDFGRSLTLARYLSSREPARPRPWPIIPKALKGHAVLVAMACEEIVMAPDAVIGQAGIDEPGRGSDRSHRCAAAIERSPIAAARFPAEVALGMLDKNVEVLKVETEVSPEFVLRRELEN